MNKIIATYDYRDASGKILFQVCRMEPKDFRTRRPDGNGGWIWNLKGVERIIYRFPEIHAADPQESVFVFEGEKDVDRAASLKLVATTNAGGVGKWRPEYTEALKGRHIILVPDNDEPGRKHVASLAQDFLITAKSVKIVTLPNLPPKGDFSDWADQGGTREALLSLVETTPLFQDHTTRPRRPASFEEVNATFRQWLLIADAGLLRVLLGAYIANNMGGDPFWLFIVAPSGGTKTEPIRSLSKLPFIYTLSDLTEQTFLSGDTKNPKASLLYQLGEKAILVMKDFTTVLSMRHEKRAIILSQLREIFDGYYAKPFGTGERKEWEGSIGFIAGVTPIVDQYHAVYAVLGERFLQYRPTMPKRRDVAKRAMENEGKETEMREALQNVVTRYISELILSDVPPSVPLHLTDCISALADVCARARSGIVRDTYHTREIELVPDPELPTRIAKQLKKITVAFAVMRNGEFRNEDYALAWKIGMDSIPKHRRAILQFLENRDTTVSTSTIATSLGTPTKTTHRTLEDLNALALIERSKLGEHSNTPDLWILTKETRELLREAKGVPISPYSSGSRAPENSDPMGRSDDNPVSFDSVFPETRVASGELK